MPPKASLDASQADKYRAHMLDGVTIEHVKDIYNTKMAVEKHITVEGLHLLACKMTKDYVVTINGIAYTQKDCYTKALEIDPQYAHSFYNLGVLLAVDETVTINGTDYTKKDCFIKATEMDPGYERGFVSGRSVPVSELIHSLLWKSRSA